MPLKSVPLILCSCQRSGTVALTEALSASGQLKSFYEVFHHNPEIKDGNFFYWLENISPIKSAIQRTDQQAEQLFLDFLQYLDGLHDQPFMCIDIKYNQWGNVAGSARNIFYPPLLMQLCKRHGFPIIHLLRKNSFLNHLSQLYARETGQWHYRGQSPTSSAVSLVVEPLAAMHYIDSVEKYKEMFRRFLKPYPNKAEIFYEQTFSEEGLSRDARSRLSQILPAAMLDNARLNTFKSPYDARDVVSNKAELLAYFYNTPHEWMLLEALS